MSTENEDVRKIATKHGINRFPSFAYFDGKFTLKKVLIGANSLLLPQFFKISNSLRNGG
jgi:hypothetical protein